MSRGHGPRQGNKKPRLSPGFFVEPESPSMMVTADYFFFGMYRSVIVPS
jgi:hypothetical protein